MACKARGRFRKDGSTPFAGDLVEIEIQEDGGGYIQELLPRKNRLVRPPIANVDQIVIVCSKADPETSTITIDRLAALAAILDIGVVICVNKSDLDSAEELFSIYSKATLPTVRVSAETGEGIEELKSLLVDKISVFAGNSGVGKSSLLNLLDPAFAMEVGDISQRIGQGRQTTRHTELLPISGGYAADSPGFSAFSMIEAEMYEIDNLQFGFVEFLPYLTDCRFNDCTHTGEPGCAVTAAVEEGIIGAERHENYKILHNELKGINQWEIKKDK